MKKYIMSLAALIFCCSATLTAQDKRGDTDYTNNRKPAEKKQDQPQVNTKQETPVKIIQFIPGTWTMEQVLRGNEDISATDTVAQSQMLVFNREGRYMSYSGSEKIDSGAYRINEDHAILYMSSELSQNTSEWNVWFGDGTMTLKLRDGVRHGEKFSYTYRRTDNARRD